MGFKWNVGTCSLVSGVTAAGGAFKGIIQIHSTWITKLVLHSGNINPGNGKNASSKQYVCARIFESWRDDGALQGANENHWNHSPFTRLFFCARWPGVRARLRRDASALANL